MKKENHFSQLFRTFVLYLKQSWIWFDLAFLSLHIAHHRAQYDKTQFMQLCYIHCYGLRPLRWTSVTLGSWDLVSKMGSGYIIFIHQVHRCTAANEC